MKKRDLKKNGRPTPELKDLKQQKGTKVIKTFQTASYSKKEWLCGCTTTKKALLFHMFAIFCI